MGARVEIQRLIGRSLRGVVDFEALGERTIYLDCDVLQADGGTRCASITGAYVALALACARLQARGPLERSPLTGLGRRGLLRDRRRRGAAGSRLLRGLDRGGRRERRDDGRGRAGRGAGHGRAHAALARAPGRAAGARGARHRAAARPQAMAIAQATLPRAAAPSGMNRVVHDGCCWPRATSTSGASSRAVAARARRSR